MKHRVRLTPTQKIDIFDKNGELSSKPCWIAGKEMDDAPLGVFSLCQKNTLVRVENAMTWYDTALVNEVYLTPVKSKLLQLWIVVLSEYLVMSWNS